MRSPAPGLSRLERVRLAEGFADLALSQRRAVRQIRVRALEVLQPDRPGLRPRKAVVVELLAEVERGAVPGADLLRSQQPPAHHERRVRSAAVEDDAWALLSDARSARLDLDGLEVEQPVSVLHDVVVCVFALPGLDEAEPLAQPLPREALEDVLCMLVAGFIPVNHDDDLEVAMVQLDCEDERPDILVAPLPGAHHIAGRDGASRLERADILLALAQVDIRADAEPVRQLREPVEHPLNSAERLPIWTVVAQAPDPATTPDLLRRIALDRTAPVAEILRLEPYTLVENLTVFVFPVIPGNLPAERI